METAMKESILAVLSARSYVYAMMHTCMGAETTKALMDTITSEEASAMIALLDSEENGFAREFLSFLSHYRGLDAGDIDRLKAEYTTLFIGPYRLIAPPWESVYTSVNRTLFTCTTSAVRTWYKKYGYLPDGYPHVAEDHIAFMLHFMSLLCERCMAHIKRDEYAQAKAVLEDQKAFLTQHLLSPWTGRYVEDLQKSQTLYFYPILGKHMLDFLRYDKEILEECMQAM